MTAKGAIQPAPGVKLPATERVRRPAEAEALEAEIRQVIPDAETWLTTPNSALFGHAPAELMEEGRLGPIRELLYSVVHVGVS